MIYVIMKTHPKYFMIIMKLYLNNDLNCMEVSIICINLCPKKFFRILIFSYSAVTVDKNDFLVIFRKEMYFHNSD